MAVDKKKKKNANLKVKNLKSAQQQDAASILWVMENGNDALKYSGFFFT